MEEILRMDELFGARRHHKENMECKLKNAIDNNKDVMIGLSHITELQSLNNVEPPKYKCSLCDIYVGLKFIITHITGLQHRSKYLEKYHPDKYEKMESVKTRAARRSLMEEHARDIEAATGREQINVELLDSPADSWEGGARPSNTAPPAEQISASTITGGQYHGRTEPANEMVVTQTFVNKGLNQSKQPLANQEFDDQPLANQEFDDQPLANQEFEEQPLANQGANQEFEEQPLANQEFEEQPLANQKFDMIVTQTFVNKRLNLSMRNDGNSQSKQPLAYQEFEEQPLANLEFEEQPLANQEFEEQPLTNQRPEQQFESANPGFQQKGPNFEGMPSPYEAANTDTEIPLIMAPNPSGVPMPSESEKTDKGMAEKNARSRGRSPDTKPEEETYTYSPEELPLFDQLVKKADLHFPLLGVGRVTEMWNFYDEVTPVYQCWLCDDFNLKPRDVLCHLRNIRHMRRFTATLSNDVTKDCGLGKSSTETQYELFAKRYEAWHGRECVQVVTLGPKPGDRTDDLPHNRMANMEIQGMQAPKVTHPLDVESQDNPHEKPSPIGDSEHGVDVKKLFEKPVDKNWDWKEESELLEMKMKNERIVPITNITKFQSRIRWKFTNFPNSGANWLTEFWSPTHRAKMMPWYTCSLCEELVDCHNTIEHCLSIRHLLLHMRHRYPDMYELMLTRSFETALTVHLYLQYLSNSIAKQEADSTPRCMLDREISRDRTDIKDREQRKSRDRREIKDREQRKSRDRTDIKDREQRKSRDRTDIKDREQRKSRDRTDIKDREQRKSRDRTDIKDREQRKSRDRTEIKDREQRKSRDRTEIKGGGSTRRIDLRDRRENKDRDSMKESSHGREIKGRDSASKASRDVKKMKREDGTNTAGTSASTSRSRLEPGKSNFESRHKETGELQPDSYLSRLSHSLNNPREVLDVQDLHEKDAAREKIAQLMKLQKQLEEELTNKGLQSDFSAPKLQATQSQANVPPANLHAPQLQFMVPPPNLHAPQLQASVTPPNLHAPQLQANVPPANLHAPQLQFMVAPPNLHAPQLQASVPPPNLHAPQLQAEDNVPPANLHAPQLQFMVAPPNVHAPQLQASVPLPNLHAPQLQAGVPPPNLHAPRLQAGVPPPNLHAPQLQASVPRPNVHAPQLQASVPPPNLHALQLQAGVPPPNFHAPQLQAGVPPPNLHAPQLQASVPRPNLVYLTPQLQVGVHPPNLNAPMLQPGVLPPNLPASELQAVVPPQNIHAPQLQTSVPPSNIHAPQLQVGVPPPNLHTPQLQAGVPPPNLHAHQLQASVPPPNLHAPQLQVGVPPPNLHVLQLQAGVPAPNLHAPQLQASVPLPNRHAPQLQAVVPPPNIHAPQLQAGVPPPNIHAPQLQTNIPALNHHTPQLPADVYDPNHPPIHDENVGAQRQFARNQSFQQSESARAQWLSRDDYFPHLPNRQPVLLHSQQQDKMEANECPPQGLVQGQFSYRRRSGESKLDLYEEYDSLITEQREHGVGHVKSQGSVDHFDNRTEQRDHDMGLVMSQGSVGEFDNRTEQRDYDMGHVKSRESVDKFNNRSEQRDYDMGHVQSQGSVEQFDKRTEQRDHQRDLKEIKMTYNKKNHKTEKSSERSLNDHKMQTANKRPLNDNETQTSNERSLNEHKIRTATKRLRTDNSHKTETSATPPSPDPVISLEFGGQTPDKIESLEKITSQRIEGVDQTLDEPQRKQPVAFLEFDTNPHPSSSKANKGIGNMTYDTLQAPTEIYERNKQVAKQDVATPPCPEPVILLEFGGQPQQTLPSEIVRHKIQTATERLRTDNSHKTEASSRSNTALANKDIGKSPIGDKTKLHAPQLQAGVPSSNLHVLQLQELYISSLLNARKTPFNQSINQLQANAPPPNIHAPQFQASVPAQNLYAPKLHANAPAQNIHASQQSESARAQCLSRDDYSPTLPNRQSVLLHSQQQDKMEANECPPQGLVQGQFSYRRRSGESKLDSYEEYDSLITEQREHGVGHVKSQGSVDHFESRGSVDKFDNTSEQRDYDMGHVKSLGSVDDFDNRTEKRDYDMGHVKNRGSVDKFDNTSEKRDYNMGHVKSRGSVDKFDNRSEKRDYNMGHVKSRGSVDKFDNRSDERDHDIGHVKNRGSVDNFDNTSEKRDYNMGHVKSRGSVDKFDNRSDKRDHDIGHVKSRGSVDKFDNRSDKRDHDIGHVKSRGSVDKFDNRSDKRDHDIGHVKSRGSVDKFDSRSDKRDHDIGHVKSRGSVDKFDSRSDKRDHDIGHVKSRGSVDKFDNRSDKRDHDIGHVKSRGSVDKFDNRSDKRDHDWGRVKHKELVDEFDYRTEQRDYDMGRMKSRGSVDKFYNRSEQRDYDMGHVKSRESVDKFNNSSEQRDYDMGRVKSRRSVDEFDNRTEQRDHEKGRVKSRRSFDEFDNRKVQSDHQRDLKEIKTTYNKKILKTEKSSERSLNDHKMQTANKRPLNDNKTETSNERSLNEHKIQTANKRLRTDNCHKTETSATPPSPDPVIITSQRIESVDQTLDEPQRKQPVAFLEFGTNPHPSSSKANKGIGNMTYDTLQAPTEIYERNKQVAEQDVATPPSPEPVISLEFGGHPQQTLPSEIFSHEVAERHQAHEQFIDMKVCGLTSSDGQNKRGTKRDLSCQSRDGMGFKQPGLSEPREGAHRQQGADEETNPVCILIQYQQARKKEMPMYTVITEGGMPGSRDFIIQVEAGGVSCTGVGPNKKLARRAAAAAMMLKLDYKPSPQSSKPAIKMPNVATLTKKQKSTVMNVDPMTHGGNTSKNWPLSQKKKRKLRNRERRKNELAQQMETPAAQVKMVNTAKTTATQATIKKGGAKSKPPVHASEASPVLKYAPIELNIGFT